MVSAIAAMLGALRSDAHTSRVFLASNVDDEGQGRPVRLVSRFTASGRSLVRGSRSS
jgi:hypothetical protein